MADELYIHTWSNGDISIYCLKCAGLGVYNYATGVNGYRVWSYSVISGEKDLTGMKKFVGCRVCRRGAEITVVRKSIYQLRFGNYVVAVDYSLDFLGNRKFHLIPWTYYNTQDIYDGNVGN